MASNSFGKFFRWNSFGESHGPAMGVVIDGCPAGVKLNEDLLLKNMESRRPGKAGASGRSEKDQPEILSGIYQGKTLGTPIAVVVRNNDQRSQDYTEVSQNPRVGHADDLWNKKFENWDHRGGGRASARETLNWVIAGSFAQMFVQQTSSDVQIKCHLLEVGGKKFESFNDPSLLRFLEAAKEEGESYGALLKLEIQNPPALLGEPIFDKFKASLGHAMLLINACCGVEWGSGFDLARKRGTEVHTTMQSSVYGGVRGGITTGETLELTLAFKPTSSIQKVAKQGRHDPCVGLRAWPIVEAMSWNVLADAILAKRLNNLQN